MRQLPFRPTIWIALLGVLLALPFTMGTAHAACGPGSLSDACSTNYGLARQVSAPSAAPPA